jgi:hypothetical protein
VSFQHEFNNFGLSCDDILPVCPDSALIALWATSTRTTVVSSDGAVLVDHSATNLHQSPGHSFCINRGSEFFLCPVLDVGKTSLKITRRLPGHVGSSLAVCRAFANIPIGKPSESSLSQHQSLRCQHHWQLRCLRRFTGWRLIALDWAHAGEPITNPRQKVLVFCFSSLTSILFRAERQHRHAGAFAVAETKRYRESGNSARQPRGSCATSRNASVRFDVIRKGEHRISVDVIQVLCVKRSPDPKERFGYAGPQTRRIV